MNKKETVELALIQKDISSLLSCHTENKADIKEIKAILTQGEGKISSLKANVKALWWVSSSILLMMLAAILFKVG